MEGQREAQILGEDVVNGSFRELPFLYLGLLSIWTISISCWASNTRRNRHSQLKNLQWILAAAPLTKVLQLGMSLLFWHACLHLETCSLWLSYGVYVFGIFYQITTFVCFILISNGYCILFEHLSINDRRRTGALGCFLYYSLIGYKVNLPYSTVFVLIFYLLAFSMIFSHISQNLSALREQMSSNYLDGSYRNDNGIHDMIQAKLSMYKKFQGAMQIVAMAEIMMNMNIGDIANDYKFRMLARECSQFCIFIYIGWIFRPQEISFLFSIMPSVKSRRVIPVYRIEIDATDFKDLTSHPWQVGLPKPLHEGDKSKSTHPLLVIIQHPT